MIKDMYIKRAIYLGNFIIMFENTDSEMRKIDFKTLLSGNMGAFECLKKEDNFKNFFISEVGILTWDVDLPKKNNRQINQYDIAPEYIYENSTPVTVHKGEYRIQVAQQV